MYRIALHRARALVPRHAERSLNRESVCVGPHQLQCHTHRQPSAQGRNGKTNVAKKNGIIDGRFSLCNLLWLWQ